MTLGNKIYHLRCSRNISQENLAYDLDVSRQSVSKWETDQSIPELSKLVLLSKYFNISVDALINDDIQIEDRPIEMENRPIDIGVKPIETDKEVKNNLKRVSRILLKTCIYVTPVYLFLLILILVFQKQLLKNFNHNVVTNVYPIYIIISALVYTFLFIFFAVKVYQRLHQNISRIGFEIFALCILFLIPPIINQLCILLQGYEFYKSSNEYTIITQHLLVNQYIGSVSYFKMIPTMCFFIGCAISLTVRKIDSHPYVKPVLKQNEQVEPGFQFLAFFMGLFSGITIIIFSIILANEWDVDQPVTRKIFINYFIIGFVTKIVLILLYIIIKSLF